MPDSKRQQSSSHHDRKANFNVLAAVALVPFAMTDPAEGRVLLQLLVVDAVLDVEVTAVPHGNADVVSGPTVEGEARVLALLGGHALRIPGEGTDLVGAAVVALQDVVLLGGGAVVFLSGGEREGRRHEEQGVGAHLGARSEIKK